MTEPSLPIIDGFRSQLVSVADRPARSRMPLSLAIPLALALAGVVAALALPSGGTPSALAVEHTGDRVEVRLHDATAGPWELTQQLRAAGVRAEVLVAPAAEDDVGTWVHVDAPRVLPADEDASVHGAYDEAAEQRAARDRLKGVEIDGDVVSIPAGYEHELVLIAGVAPERGQPPVYGPSGRVTAP